MKPPQFVLPEPVGKLLARLPCYPGSVLFVAALNLALRQHLASDVRQSLQHRQLRIHVRDAQLTFDFQWIGERFVACPRALTTDLTISANASDFLALAQRQADPDTLFFNRRLTMQGDTELGLMIKNSLDAMELPVLDLRHFTLHDVFARLKRARAAR